MSVYYPQAAMTLQIRWEDFGKATPALKELHTLTVIPKRLTVHINDYTTADTFDCEIDYKTFPFDPRTIRACGVTIHLQDMKELYNRNVPVQLVPAVENTIFQGFVDEESIDFDDERRTVKFEGRDFTSIFIDSKYLVGTPPDMGTPLNELITALVKTLPAANKIKVENRTGTTLPALKQFYPDFGLTSMAGGRNTAPHETYWDLITDFVARAGLICYIEQDKLVINTPRILYDKSNAKQFLYGGNVKSLEFKRKLGRHKKFNVIVRCLARNSKEVIDAKIPKEATDDWTKATGIANIEVTIPVIRSDGSLDTAAIPQKAPYMSFRVKDIADKNQLIKVGETIFEELSRQQIEGSFETHEMDVMDKKHHCFDLTKLKIGTPIAVEIDNIDLFEISKPDPKIPGSTVPQASLARRIHVLVKRGYPPEFAQVFAEVLGSYTPVFFTKSASYSMDSENGFKLKVEFLNFIDLDNKGISFG